MTQLNSGQDDNAGIKGFLIIGATLIALIATGSLPMAAGVALVLLGVQRQEHKRPIGANLLPSSRAISALPAASESHRLPQASKYYPIAGVVRLANGSTLEVPPVPGDVEWNMISMGQFIQEIERFHADVKQSGGIVAEPQFHHPDLNGLYATTQALPAATIGEQTRLGAIDVATLPSPHPSHGATAADLITTRTVHNVPQSQVIDIAESLAVNLQSTLIVGQPGSGKGVTIAMATRAVKRLHPDVEIWAIDPKVDPSESWYWQAVDRYLPVKIEPFTSAASVKKIMEAIDDFICKFQSSNSPKLLIFDEALAVKEKTGSWFTGLMPGFNALCSMGRSRRQYGWLVSQSPNTGDFGISGGVRNVYRRILLLSADNLGLLDNGSTFFSGKPSPEVLQPTKRAFFDSTINGWGAIPIYSTPSSPVKPVATPQPEQKPSGESRRERLEALMNEDAASPVEKFYHSGDDDLERSLGSETDSDEFALRSEVKRFLLANPDGSKPRDLANKARTPVRKMLVDDIKLVLDLMALEGEIYEVNGVFFCNSN